MYLLPGDICINSVFFQFVLFLSSFSEERRDEIFFNGVCGGKICMRGSKSGYRIDLCNAGAGVCNAAAGVNVCSCEFLRCVFVFEYKCMQYHAAFSLH